MIVCGESATISGCSVLDTVVISGDEVCWNAVFGTLVGVSVFSDMCSELPMTSAISCRGGHHYMSARVKSEHSHLQ